MASSLQRWLKMSELPVFTDFTREDVLNYLLDRFGIEKATLGNFSMFSTEKGKIFLGPKHILCSEFAVSIGLLCFRSDYAIKPTTNLLQIIGKNAKRNLVDLTKEQTQNYLCGNDLVLSLSQLSNCTDGYILLKYDGFSLGCGLLKKDQLKNTLPKAKRLDIKFF